MENEKKIYCNPAGSDRTFIYLMLPNRMYEDGAISKRQFKKLLKMYDKMRREKK